MSLRAKVSHLLTHHAAALQCHELQHGQLSPAWIHAAPGPPSQLALLQHLIASYSPKQPKQPCVTHSLIHEAVFSPTVPLLPHWQKSTSAFHTSAMSSSAVKRWPAWHGVQHAIERHCKLQHAFRIYPALGAILQVLGWPSALVTSRSAAPVVTYLIVVP